MSPPHLKRKKTPVKDEKFPHQKALNNIQFELIIIATSVSFLSSSSSPSLIKKTEEARGEERRENKTEGMKKPFMIKKNPLYINLIEKLFTKLCRKKM